MPVLTGAITALTLVGTPGLPLGDLTKNPSPASGRLYEIPFCRLGLTGAPSKRFASFAGKVEKTEDAKFVTDTIRVYVTEGEFDEIELDVTETLRAVVSDRGSAGLSQTVADTITPRVTETAAGLDKAGSVPITCLDTVTPVVTETVTYRVALTVAETITPVISDSVTVAPSDEATVTDTITPMLVETVRLQSQLAARAFAVSDTVTPRVTESVGAGARGDVDIIRIVERPFGRIRITEA